ncbi:MAG TPA: TIGR02466 family protein [Steroidobacteraceae bacterium]|nr:TIGR02466 family protein [Steroidobacteraceae bacterium]
MSIHVLFPTLVYRARLQRGNWQDFNNRLQRECLQLRADDAAGRRWSKHSYPGGYTSYASLSRLYQISPSFEALRLKLNRHVHTYVRQLEWQMEGRSLAMTDCWLNIMPRGVAHSLHLHPLAAVSGTYYVSTPPGSAGLKLEDPRLDRFMAAPPRKPDCAVANRPWVTLPAEAGGVLLFESWLRHEVPSNLARQPRISVSFNYGWF